MIKKKKESPLIKATSFKSKEHFELRQPSIYPLSIKERTHTPLCIYLAKCSINIKLISPSRVSITQTFFSQLISLVIVLVYRGKSRQVGSKWGGRAVCFHKPANKHGRDSSSVRQGWLACSVFLDFRN